MVAAAERSSLYAAYVGIAQVAGSQQAVADWRRDWARRRARAAGDDALLSRLAAGGPVTEDDLFRHGGELVGAQSFWPILLAGLAAPEFTLQDVWNVRRGVVRVNASMTGDELPLDERVTRLPLPTFFFLGRHDANTPGPLAAAFLEKLQAPVKRVVWFDESAHFPFREQPARFHEAMLAVHDLTEAFREAESGKDVARSDDQAIDRESLIKREALQR